MPDVVVQSEDVVVQPNKVNTDPAAKNKLEPPARTAPRDNERKTTDVVEDEAVTIEAQKTALALAGDIVNTELAAENKLEPPARTAPRDNVSKTTDAVRDEAVTLEAQKTALALAGDIVVQIMDAAISLAEAAELAADMSSNVVTSALATEKVRQPVACLRSDLCALRACRPGFLPQQAHSATVEGSDVALATVTPLASEVEAPVGTPAAVALAATPAAVVSAPFSAPVSIALATEAPTVVVPATEAEWREKLSAEEFRALREKATEKEGSGEYDRFYPKEGFFVCRGCANPLFSYASKFKAGCGWPSFDRCYKGSLHMEPDTAHGMQRVEVTCVECRSHLGHVFEGEKLTESDQRHCINSLSIKYVHESPPEWLAARGEVKLDTSTALKQMRAALAAAPVAPQANRPASDIDMSDAALAAAWDITCRRDAGWCVCSYTPNSKTKLVLVASGGEGTTELRRHLTQDAVSYGVLPATVDGRPRSVFFTFVGEETSAMKRGRAAIHSPHVEKYFQGTVGALPVISTNLDFEDDALNMLVKQLCKTAAHAQIR